MSVKEKLEELSYETIILSQCGVKIESKKLILRTIIINDKACTGFRVYIGKGFTQTGSFKRALELYGVTK